MKKIKHILIKVVILICPFLILYWLIYTSEPLSGKEIDSKIRDCTKYNLDYRIFSNALTKSGGVTDIFCVPKEDI